jgi:hypothetical protein
MVFSSERLYWSLCKTAARDWRHRARLTSMRAVKPTRAHKDHTLTRAMPGSTQRHDQQGDTGAANAHVP